MAERAALEQEGRAAVTDLKEVPRLKPQTVRDAERVAQVIKRLNAQHAAGHVRELLYVTVDERGDYSYFVSGNMPVSHFSMAITYLQRDLMTLLDRPEREPPQTLP